MYYLIGYVVLLTFTIGLLAWVSLLKTEWNKKTKITMSAIILAVILVLSIIFMSFLPSKWTNILYFLALLMGFVLAAIIIYVIVALVSNTLNKSSKDDHVSYKEQIQKLKEAANKRIKEKQSQTSKTPAKETPKKKQIVKLSKDKGNNNQKVAHNPQTSSNKQVKQQNQKKNNKQVKQNKAKNSKQQNKNTKQTSTKQSGKKKGKPRRLEDYEPSQESVATKLTKPEKTTFGGRHK